MAATKPRRKMLVCTMLPDLYAKAHAAAAKRDMPVTAWVREVVEEKLQTIPD